MRARRRTRSGFELQMAQTQKLPEAHTDFIVSVQWDTVVWVLVGLAGVVAVVITVLLYRRRRRN
jgi:cell division protein FtsW (lipid II flippase)